jgi:predicted ester cyclase
MTITNDALIRRWFEEVWNQGRAEAIGEMLDVDGIVHGLSDDNKQALRGPDAFRVFHKAFHEAFPDIVVTVEDTISEGDKVARAVRCAASTPATV